jgi:hypothetical protein
MGISLLKLLSGQTDSRYFGQQWAIRQWAIRQLPFGKYPVRLRRG